MRIVQNQKVVLGPPGTGKTTRLLSMIEGMIASGIKPEEIAFVSFTKKAVKEATQRASKKFNMPERRFANFQTVHAFTFRQLGCTKQNLLNRNNYLELGQLLGYDMSGQTGDMEEGLIASGAAPGDKFLFLDNLSRVRCEPLRKTWERENSDGEVSWEELSSFSAGYAKYKERTGLMDFTDLLLRYAEDGRPVGAKIVFVDEAQDLSNAQWRVIQRAYAGADEVIIAGDDDQSIFKWSGADLDAFLNLEGEREVLDHSYRLPRTVHRLANRIIKQVGHRFEKAFSPREAEGDVDYITSLDQVNINPEETTMILVRNVFLLTAVYSHIKRLGHTYVGRGNMPSVLAGHVQAIRAWEHLRKGGRIGYTDAVEVYENLRIGRMLARGGKAKLDQSEDIERGYDLEHLTKHYGLLETPPWFEALEGIPLETRDYYQNVLRSGRKISVAPKITCNTIHGVKGGEAQHVIILSDMSRKTYMEMQKDMDSEHRVAFVAVTRASERLTIVTANSKFSYPY